MDRMEVVHGDDPGWKECIEPHVFCAWRTLLGHHGDLLLKVWRVAGPVAPCPARPDVEGI